MGAKNIALKVIPAKTANAFVKKQHYSGKYVQNSKLHFGVFYNKILHGVMQYGPSLDKRKMQGLVKGTGWNDFIELNRLAFDDKLPRNSESRALSISFKMIKKHAPHIKWIVSLTKGKHILQNGASSMSVYKKAGWKPIKGFQLRYIYFMDKSKRKDLTVPEIPFSKIEEVGASMYKGKRTPVEDSPIPGVKTVQI